MNTPFSDYEINKQEFSQVPFWFWNDQLSQSEITRQMADFQHHGIHAFVIHPRAGLPRHLGWMSPELLGYMRFAIEEAARRGMWILLYDEGMYPSGSSCGQVVAENPAYACRGLVQVDLTMARPGDMVQGVQVGQIGVKLTGSQTLVAEVNRRHDGHRMAIVDQPIGSTIRGIHFKDDDPGRRADCTEVEEDHPPAGDLLNPVAMQCFIRLVYQRYDQEFGDHFGKTIKGIFTDEPGLLGKGRPAYPKLDPRPGTTGILEHVNAFLGYDFTPHLPALWDDAEPDSLRHRQAYARAVRHRLQETYYQPISTWCAAHNVALTGHPAKSDDIGLLRHFQIPGQDIVLRYIEPDTESALTGPHSTMAKCASSAMIHLNRRRNLNEFAGAYGHQLTFEEYRWLALWLLVRGCNMLSPHAFYYSIRGPRIDERPRDVGPNSPWWDDYAGFAEMTGRLCWLNTDSQHVCSVAILGQDDRLPWASARVCFENQIDFNYLEDRHLGEEAAVTPDGLRIGSMLYTVLIIESGYDSDLSPQAKMEIARLNDQGRVLHCKPAPNPARLLKAVRNLVPDDVLVEPLYSGLRIRHVRKGGKDFIIVFNEGDRLFKGQVTISGAACGHEVDMETGHVRDWVSGAELELLPHACRVLSFAGCNIS